ncbi:MAG: TonB family protein [Chitinispirillaceae bacterium]|nr:TonB family protein [Chitinispirillaceae bacterium]
MIGISSLRRVIVFAHALILLSQFYGGSESNDAPNPLFSAEPRLLSSDKVDFPALLVKRSVEGTIEIHVNIDDSGKVVSCETVAGLDPLLDSLVLSAMRAARFSPAYESGKTVPATVALRLGFDLTSILSNSANAVPELCGVVIDRSTGKPIHGATVTIECLDSLSDSIITIGMGEYLALIGKVPGQSFFRGTLSTTADEHGAFFFRLLPDGTVRVVVSAQWYKAGHFTEKVRTGNKKRVMYYCDPFTLMTGDSIVVYGRTERRRVMNIEEQQYATGLTTYLSDMIKSQTVITGVPEAASLMTARGGSPFNNRYLICGVPFLAPFHFGGHPYADIDGMMISSLTKVTIVVDRIAGRFPEASGILIEADPGIYRSDNRKLVKRPELSVDYGSLSQDIMLSIPVSSEHDDFVQLGYSGSKEYYLQWLKVWYDMHDDAAIGISPPVTMGNLTLTGTKRTGFAQADAFGWFAWDTYWPVTGHETFFPWGMGSIGIHPPGQDYPQVRYGGSRQYFMQGKRVGPNAFLKIMYLSNYSVSLFTDTIRGHDFSVQVNCRLDNEHWHGSVIQRDMLGKDTGVCAQGRDIRAVMRGSADRQFGPVALSTDVLGSLLFYQIPEAPEPMLDAGISLLWESGPLQAVLHAGRVTSRPDIRGLPDPLFRKKHLHTWLLSLPLFFYDDGIPMRLGLQPYVRYQDRTPSMDPLLSAWDERLTTPMFGEGVDVDAEVFLREWISWKCAVNLSRADRIKNDTLIRYELNAPWTFRSNLHLNYRKRFHIYLKGITTSLSPYYDFVLSRYSPLPLFMRWDLNLHYRTERPKHRFLTRYDGYFNINNVWGGMNVSDCYWDRSMTRQNIPMCSWAIMELGVRLGFRL